MALYLKNCFLAFLCLYRSKSYGIRKRVVDHPYGSRAGNPRPPAPSFLQRWIHHSLYPANACPAASRIRAVTTLGSKYPRSLGTVLWLASLALTVRGTYDRIVGTVILNAVKNLPLLREGDPSPPQATDQDDVHQRSFPRCKGQVLNTAIDLIRERFLLISLRFAKVRIKGLPYRKHSLKDGSRHVCMPSYLKPREFP